MTKMGEGITIFRIITGKTTGNRHLERPRYRWEDNIIICLRVICVNTRGWIDSAQYRDYWRAHVIASFNLRVP